MRLTTCHLDKVFTGLISYVPLLTLKLKTKIKNCFIPFSSFCLKLALNPKMGLSRDLKNSVQHLRIYQSIVELIDTHHFWIYAVSKRLDIVFETIYKHVCQEVAFYICRRYGNAKTTD